MGQFEQRRRHFDRSHRVVNHQRLASARGPSRQLDDQGHAQRGAINEVTMFIFAMLPKRFPVIGQCSQQAGAPPFRLTARKNQLFARALADGVTAVQRRRQIHKQIFAEYDRVLDAERDGWLARVDIAEIIRRNLYHHNGTKYRLLAYCVMPNHVHVLLQPRVDEAARFVSPSVDEAARFVSAGEASRFVYEPCGEQPDSRSPLTSIMHSLKSYTAHEANKLLGRSGQFWQHESYDHWVRDDEELKRILEYIAGNPVKAGLVGKAWEWAFCSARDRYLRDGVKSGWLGDIDL